MNSPQSRRGCYAAPRRAEALAGDIAAPEFAVFILDPAQVGSAPPVPAKRRRKSVSRLDGLYAKGKFQRDALEAIRAAAGPVNAHSIDRDLATRKGLRSMREPRRSPESLA
ncbi:hypothetical protein [Muricoccus vinaceus]|uniref:Uncharacterized protein n=1 Tax=Muricoccus vinaceus TaxID=424704 RepID=A0ABV6IZX1_9PROT